jgi:hypothetical protein
VGLRDALKSHANDRTDMRGRQSSKGTSRPELPAAIGCDPTIRRIKMRVSTAVSTACTILVLALICQVEPSQAFQTYYPCTPEWVSTCQNINIPGEDTCITYSCVAFAPYGPGYAPPGLPPKYGVSPTCVANFRTAGSCTNFNICVSAGTCAQIPGTSQTGGPLGECSSTAMFACPFGCRCAATTKGKAGPNCLPLNPKTTASSSCPAPQLRRM